MLQILFNYFFDKPITLSYIYIWISFLKLYIKLVLILLKNTNIVHIYLFNYFIYERYILIFIANFEINLHVYHAKSNLRLKKKNKINKKLKKKKKKKKKILFKN